MIRVYWEKWDKKNESWEPVLAGILKKDYGLDEITIERDRYGKPFLKQGDLFFNVSHSGDYLAAAVSEKPVGIDLERIRQVKEGMYRKVVRPEEQVLIGTDRTRDFIRLWTLKESFVKAEGYGMRIPFKKYYFSREENRLCVYYEGKKAPWIFHVKELPEEGYFLSVCGMEREVLFRTE